MPVATPRTVCLQGMSGHLIDVQADVTQGMIGTHLVGRGDASVNEGRDRCRAAIVNSGLKWPTTRRVTVLLSPADLPKSGPHFDVAIAAAILVASGEVEPVDPLESWLFLGELGLDGNLRAVPGVLPMVLAGRDRGLTRVMVPDSQADEAALVPGVDVIGVRSLQQVVALLCRHLRHPRDRQAELVGVTLVGEEHPDEVLQLEHRRVAFLAEPEPQRGTSGGSDRVDGPRPLPGRPDL